MAEIVNLRRVRKQKAREEDAARAEQNRARFGTPKPERVQRAAEDERGRREHERHKIEKD